MSSGGDEGEPLPHGSNEDGAEGDEEGDDGDSGNGSSDASDANGNQPAKRFEERRDECRN